MNEAKIFPRGNPRMRRTDLSVSGAKRKRIDYTPRVFMKAEDEPLCLSVEFLAACQSGLAVRLRPSAFRRLSVFRIISKRPKHNYIGWPVQTFSLLLVIAQVFEKVELAQWACRVFLR
jgi:hypothetical protein